MYYREKSQRLNYNCFPIAAAAGAFRKRGEIYAKQSPSDH